MAKYRSSTVHTFNVKIEFNLSQAMGNKMTNEARELVELE